MKHCLFQGKPLRHRFLVFVMTFSIFVSCASFTWAGPAFTAFESGQVRPLALSPNGQRLFAVNTPDNRLEVFLITKHGLKYLTSIPVGLEPVAVAALSNNEVWVVNHLSDSVSIVKLSGQRGVVTRTLLVGDEPRDIVFAGTKNKKRAFITAAHRGQNTPFNSSLTDPGVGRADVWVFDVDDQGDSLGGTPVSIINLFSDTPRALAVSADGERVYAASFMSGNQTALVALNQTPDGGEAGGGIPLPNVNHAGMPEPNMSLIVKFNGTDWVDETGKSWNDYIKFDLPDYDVFSIDATGITPVLDEAKTVANVGTVIFNLIVNPVTGKVYATNTEARNEVRFEGKGNFAATTVRGHAVDNRITVIEGVTAKPRLLNKHIDYDKCCKPIPNAENALSVSQPNGMAITSDGKTLYVSVLGNNKVVIYDTSELEQDTFFPRKSDQISVTGGGPTGLTLDEKKEKLYVFTRFNNGISIIDTRKKREVGRVELRNPEPASLVDGRPFLYDAAFTSSHGDQSCASCHVFGDKDELSWDLGDPDGDEIDPPDLFRAFFGIGQIAYHPMKGPMTTQSLRGLANHGPLHWRGDRNGGNLGSSVQPDGGALSEVAAFNAFNVAFEGLLGRNKPLTTKQMQKFTDFQLQVTYPPNPIRALDNSLTEDQAFGKEFFESVPSLAIGEIFTCKDCHSTDRLANSEFGIDYPGFFGTNGSLIAGEFSQTFKIPHLRNLYTKVGAFGLGEDPIFNRPDLPLYDPSHKGQQIRAFGYTHDGSIDTIQRFLNSLAESFVPGIGFTEFEDVRRVTEFLLAFDTNLFPIVGQQITWHKGSRKEVNQRVRLLMQRASVGECDLIAKSFINGREQGYLYVDGEFLPDQRNSPALKLRQLKIRGSIFGAPITYTCTPPGSGKRMGIDRDGDGYLDGDEFWAGTDSADSNSY